MYKEKKEILVKMDEYCSINNIHLSAEEKLSVATNVLRIIRPILSEDEFFNLLEHNITLENYSDIEFNDEIVSIEEIQEEELYDIEVSGNSLFYANEILTHNSAVNNTSSGNEAISDSIGTVQTADFILFLLQTEEMKTRNEIIAKVSKNRFTGITDSFTISVDYNKMRFGDLEDDTSPLSKEQEQSMNTEIHSVEDVLQSVDNFKF